MGPAQAPPAATRSIVHDGSSKSSPSTNGSKDRTYAELLRARERWPDLLIEHFTKNKGKREAMAAGALLGRGEILPYVDSDSFLRRDVTIVPEHHLKFLKQPAP